GAPIRAGSAAWVVALKVSILMGELLFSDNWCDDGANRPAGREAPGPAPADVPLLTGALLAGVGVEAGEFLVVDAVQPARRDDPLDEAGDAALAVEAGGDVHQRLLALRGHGERRNEAGAVGVGLDPGSAPLPLGDPH